ncbi:hypothetical protein BD309DRAFT_362487 [Dichomitus squalens]|uniref:DUF7928 domain-containing protein n=1 Tax=Dichomitus squalens TaxID=114155 RepID=A0A4Q9PUR8_9APHY|nr:hypothetical protein BD309DRAFT_362487 [Dichomitus squalens]TBU58271.1 hypothetical protein BD310DRAFT_486287 [Dichomitus squalens]
MGGMDPQTEDDLNAFCSSVPLHFHCSSPALAMDASAQTLQGVFRELSRLCDGDHTVYLRTDSHSFVEIHRSGPRSLFTSTVAAFVPNVVIKLQTSLVPSIITAVTLQQGSPVLHTKSGLFIVENLAEIVNLVKQHKAAFIREDATLAVWANELQPALASLHQVLKELGVSLGRLDLVRIVEPSADYGEGLGGSDNDHIPFDDFIHGYESATPVDKISEEVAYLEAQRLALQPLGLDDTLEGLYPISRTNLFDSLSSNSPMLGDSPFLSSAVSTGMSRMSLGHASQTSLSPCYSPTSFDFDFSSPSISSGSASDCSAMSTPLTIAPSVLSSPHSSWSSPALPTIPEADLNETAQVECYDEASAASPVHCASPASSPNVSDTELTGETTSKRKRIKTKQSDSTVEVVSEKTRARRAPRASSPAKAIAPYPRRAGKTVPQAIVPVPPAVKRALAPLPSRSLRYRSSSVSSTASSVSSASTSGESGSKRTNIARLTTKVTSAVCCDDNEREILESDDSGSEYEAGASELDELDDEYDGNYRPTKRTRSVTSSTRAESPGSSVTGSVRRKAVSPLIAAEKSSARKKKSSSYGGCRRKKGRGRAKAGKAAGPRPTCIWCDREFTRESDVLRHEQSSCKLYPFERKLDYCPLCDKIISRNDAVIRHQGSEDCKKRQHELGLAKAKTAKTKAGARVAKAAKEPLSPRRRRTKS